MTTDTPDELAEYEPRGCPIPGACASAERIFALTKELDDIHESWELEIRKAMASSSRAEAAEVELAAIRERLTENSLALAIGKTALGNSLEVFWFLSLRNSQQIARAIIKHILGE
jgi:hypothetical protein